MQKYWGYDAFRPMQEDIINSVLAGKDTLALLPTGGGKSICFQVPAMCQQGLTLVISPLIALMKDQVERLNRLGIPAAYVNSSMGYHQIDDRLQKAMDGTYRFLYLAPERIASDMFTQRLPNMPVRLLVVDEAHCISQWGYDFRPAYLKIASIRETCPQVPIIALTASATPEVRQDIEEKLELKAVQRFEKSFRRDNLRYFVFEEENPTERILRICQRTQGTGIIYARTRKLTTKLAAWLQEQGVSAAAYHGGMTNSARAAVQQDWLEDRRRIMVATNAFGMGIDKADVRFVVHYNLPFDLESYYQEAGRGGRDGKTALAIAFNNPPDLAELQRWNAEKYPSWKQLNEHYKLLCNFYNIPNDGKVDQLHEFHMRELVAATKVNALQLYASLKVLSNEGIIALQEDKDDFGYIQVTAQPQDVLRYKAQHPTMADLVDFLLRVMGGQVYSQEVRFLPEVWARSLDLPPLDLYHQLQKLHQHRIIFYQAPLDAPSIRFLKARHTLQKRHLNWDKYSFLKNQNERRMVEMLYYVQQTDVCRSLLIQQYFGEKAHQPCGKCDVCIGRNKTRVSDGEFKSLQKALLAFVGKGGQTYRKVLTELPEGTPAQREKVLRYLLDKKVILSDGLGTLTLPES
ncbi:MAG: RecQ family ATP-dependent DNA helicase [Bacteroidota bacterium]